MHLQAMAIFRSIITSGRDSIPTSPNVFTYRESDGRNQIEVGRVLQRLEGAKLHATERRFVQTYIALQGQPLPNLEQVDQHL